MIHRKYRHPAIALCRRCDGKGYIAEFPKEDIFQQEESIRCVCFQCQGSGRVIVSSEMVITVMAYIPEENK